MTTPSLRLLCLGILLSATVYAGAEIIRLLGNPALQIQPPRPDAVNSALHLKPVQ